MKVHSVNENYGTLTGPDGKPLGRIACAHDQWQRLRLQSVRFTKRGVDCKRCLRILAKRKGGKT